MAEKTVSIYVAITLIRTKLVSIQEALKPAGDQNTVPLVLQVDTEAMCEGFTEAQMEEMMRPSSLEANATALSQGNEGFMKSCKN
mgnify:CR=1 FL=1